MSKATSCDDCRIVYGEHREEDIAPCPLLARAPALRDALRELLERYIYLVRESGVCRWDPETDLKVIAARAALDGL
jgi:hypothetical protein